MKPFRNPNIFKYLVQQETGIEATAKLVARIKSFIFIAFTVIL